MLRAFGRMTRFAVIGGGLAILASAALAPAPAAAAVEDLPLAGTITHSYTRPGANRPSVIAGVLTEAQDGSPVIVARNYLSGHPDPLGGVSPTSMRLERVRWHHDGAAVKFQQTHDGLDVLGGTVAVRVDGGGRVRWMSSGVTTIPASFDASPWISPEEAAARLGGGDARLVILGDPVFDTARLVWEVTLPRDLMRLRSLRGWVDAKSGEVVAVLDRARRAELHQARAYEWNPAVSALDVVTLVDLPIDAASLAGVDLEALSCVDLRTCRDFAVDGETAGYHFCEPRSMALTDGNGSFLAINRPSVDTNAFDAFAEVQLYYHASQAYAAFRGFAEDDGFTLDAKPLRALANFRLPGSIPGARCTDAQAPPTSQLAPFDDGAFVPAGAGDEGEDWLILGQGRAADQAYDGDLVFHELGHAVLARVTLLGDRVYDPFGVDPGPAALHEGYADYFAAAISGDPELAEYAGGARGSPLPSGAIRSAENDRACPDDLSGEPHRDGEIWLGGLWDVRQSYSAEDQAAVDAAVFAAMDMLGAADSMAVAQAMTTAELELAFGLAAGESAESVFRGRGLDGCRERAAKVDLGEVWPLLHVGGVIDGGSKGEGSGGAEPAPAQFIVTLAERAKELRVDYAASEVLTTPGASAGAELVLLVKPGMDPISWSWASGAGRHDAPYEGSVAVSPLAGPGSGAVQADLPAGVYRVQLANRGGARLVLHDLTFSAATAPAGADAGVGVTPPGTGPGGGAEAPIGCGCHTGAGATCSACGAWCRGAGVLAMMALAFLILRRRGR